MKINYSFKTTFLKLICTFLFFVFGLNINAQVFYTETFDGTACAATSGCDPSLVSWTTTNTGTNGANPNKFYVSCQENGNAAGVCGSGCGTDQSLHVGNISTSTAAFIFCPTGDCGAAYDDSGAGERTDKRCESPTINCTGQTNITLAFNYLENGQGANDDATLWYFDGATWTNINALAKTTVCGSGQGLWTAFSMTLPASANNNPNVKIGFRWVNNGDGNAADPSFAVDDITLSVVASANTITTGTITGSPFCACSTVNVPFTSTGTFLAGNIYTAQLSNAAGSFAAPTAIGTLASTANTGTIAATIPCATPTGSGYRIRVVSSNPAVTGSDNGVNITINATTTPSVSIAASPSGTICTGTSVTFTATPTNGGAAPTYQWQLNGSNVGTGGTTYTNAGLNNGDVVTVIMTSNATCPSPATATSNAITMTVVASLTPAVSIVASPGSTICSGTSVTFTATPTNGGTGPTYQWQLNGSNVGTGGTTYTNAGLNNGDVITVIMTSNDPCASPTTATSNAITITVTTSLTPSVSIVASPGNTICSGTSVTFTATPTNGGTTPTYQWQLNGGNVGTGGTTYTNAGLNNGDVVTVIMTSNDPCASPTTATSNGIVMTVTSSVTPSVSISAVPSPPICAGQSVTFTATPTNGGTSPTYQWQLNGSNVGTGGTTYTNAGLNNGDVVTVIMTSNDPCATPTTATSNAINITIQATVTPSVTISASTTTPCNGTAVTFTATPSGGGTAPSYQWQVNGSNAGTNSATFSSILNSGDVVTVIMTSNSPCASPTTATSNPITITTQACNEPVANFSGTPTVMCQPGCVNFTDLSTNTPTTWNWSFPGATPSSSTSQNPSNICYSANGSYTVTLIVSNADGADTLTQAGYITVGSPVTVNITGNTLINACEDAVLSAFPADGTYQWGPNVNILCENCQSATVSPSATQQYWVTYTSPQGCVDSDTTTVVVTDIYTYFMPTAFSPNGDGMNDVLQVHGRGVDYISLKVFDRVGEKVFETTELEKGWDGKLFGVPMNNAVFVYMLEVHYCNGEMVKEKGNVTLVK